MLYELIKILTTAFLLFALCFFTWDSVGKKNNTSHLSGNIVSAFFMLSAILFMWS